MNSINKAYDKLYKNLWYTHKVHEKERWLLACRISLTRWTNIVLVSGVLLLQFYQLLYPTEKAFLVWSIILAAIEVAFTFYQLSFNHGALYEQHQSTAKIMVRLKNRMISMDTSKLTEKALNQISEQLSDIYEKAPQTGLIAQWLADIDWKKEYPRKR